jgi:L-glutamine-phosphate cytidylyltransferase
MNNNKPKVILLLAGEGTRLRPYTDDCPKCMVKVDGVSLIDRQLKVLKSQGLDNIIMVGGYKSEMLTRYGYKLMCNSRYSETNMVWTLFCADTELNGDVIISYGDIVYSENILKALLNSKADIAVTIDKNWESYWRARNENPLDDAETLKIQSDGSITEIGQKPKSLDEIEGQYMGLMKFTNNGLKQLKAVYNDALIHGTLLGRNVEEAYMTDLLQAVINTGQKVMSIPTNEKWIEVDTVEDLQSSVTLSRLKSMIEV